MKFVHNAPLGSPIGGTVLEQKTRAKVMLSNTWYKKHRFNIIVSDHFYLKLNQHYTLTAAFSELSF